MVVWSLNFLQHIRAVRVFLIYILYILVSDQLNKNVGGIFIPQLSSVGDSLLIKEGINAVMHGTFYFIP